MGKSLWILNHYAISPDMSGGTRHFDLAKELVKNGHEVTIFASGFDHSTRKYVKIMPQERMRFEVYDGVRFVWLNTVPYSGNDWRRVLNMLSYAWRVMRCDRGLSKPDAVIGSSMHPFAALAGWWMARRHKARFFFEVRDLWPQTAVDMGAMKKTGLPARVLYAWEKFMYNRAEKVIVLLPYAKDYIVGKGVDVNKVVWLPNGVDLERFDNPQPLDPDLEVARVFEQNRNKFKVIYTGAHGIPNGLDVIVEAAGIIQKITQNIHFIMIGEGTEKEKLKEKARSMGLHNINFCRSISKLVVPSVLLEADCLIISIPNFDIYQYGVSLNKSFDYLASGKPIVMAGSPQNNIVEEANSGRSVEPENPEALSQAIIELSQLTERERARMGSNGRRYVEQYHSIRVLAQKLESILT